MPNAPFHTVSPAAQRLFRKSSMPTILRKKARAASRVRLKANIYRILHCRKAEIKFCRSTFHLQGMDPKGHRKQTQKTSGEEVGDMICLENRGKVTVDINISHLVDLIPVGKHASTVLKPENLSQGNCCAENQCLQKVLPVGQMKKARENFCQDNSTYESQRRYIFNWLDQNQPTVGEFAYYISGLRVCWNAWTKVLGITQRRFFQLEGISTWQAQ